MLSPKRQKYRKIFRGKNRGLAYRGSNVDFGEFGLKAMERGIVSSAQIEAARKAISHYTKREGKVWARVFPDYPVTSKAAGVRMGGGKGDLKEYSVKILPGRILFELAGVTELVASEAFRRASSKLSVQTKLVKKR